LSAPASESAADVPLPATIGGCDIEMISVGAMSLPFVRNGSFIAQNIRVVPVSRDVNSSTSSFSTESNSEALQFQPFELPETHVSAL
jgi:hypothetical protein